MLDIREIRDHADTVRERLKARGGNHWTLIDEVLACDESRRKAETSIQQLQAAKNKGAKEYGALLGQQRKLAAEASKMGIPGVDPDLEANLEKLIEGGRQNSEEIAQLQADADSAATRQHELLMEIPNLPHAACPVGQDETANPVVHTWGDKPDLAAPKDHLVLAEALGIISLEDATRIAGSGFAVYRGQGARLERALISFLLDLQSGENGYEEVNVPHVVLRECMEGTGQLPKFEDDMYGTDAGEDGRNQLFLAPTAEVPVTNLYRDTLLHESDLPKKLVACTPCFRREAGSAGRDNRGIIRMHQFDKVELVQIVHPDHGLETLEALTGHAESALQKLGLHYRTIELCTGDLGANSAKTYDIEVWAPGQGKYLEVSSCSWFSDFQARRMKLRFKDSEGKNRFCHTLNGSGTALPRLYVALMEQNQQPDGSIRIPDALVPYFGASEIR